MKRNSLIAGFLFTVSALGAQVISDTRNLGEFTGVKAGSAVVIDLAQGDACSVVVEGEPNDVKNILTTVNSGVLDVSFDHMADMDEVTVHVTVKKLSSLDIDGAAEVKTHNQLITDTLKISGGGAAEAKLDVQASLIKVVLSGASEVKVSGTTQRLEATLSGASELKGYALQSASTTVTTSGASSAHVTANSALNAVASGASDIYFQGNPTEKNVNVSGSATIATRETADSDTTNINVGGYHVGVSKDDDDERGDERSKKEKHKSDQAFEFWNGIDLGVNGILTAKNQIELPPGYENLELNYAKSYMFGWNAWQKNMHIYRNNVNLGTGIGLTWYHYNFRNSYSLQPNMPYVTSVNDSLNYSKNRLNMCYVNVPLFLEFNTNNNDARNSFHIAVGGQFGYNVFTNKLKQKYELDGHTYKRKVKDDFNVNPFRYDLIMRIGYGNFTIFGTYSMSTLFEKGKGPSFYPFAAGINIKFG